MFANILQDIDNDLKTSTLQQGPLLLTWFNLNPNLDK